ncbi:MAG: hypothetical protein B7Y88_10420 [Sphingomonadales bacterium 32-64-17]|nr:MAG: hypothetical protein B7Y88_10420 [Sphingomonadales bacterium 32-64-17]
MDEVTRNMLLETASRLPEWIRRDLAARDNGLRQRAEETLVAMIANTLVEAAAAAAHSAGLQKEGLPPIPAAIGVD